MLDLQSLFDEGRTLTYSELPDALWAATGYRIPNRTLFMSFGAIRNSITHFAVPEIDLQGETFRFAYEVLEPMVLTFWKTDIDEYLMRCDEGGAVYVHEELRRRGI